MQQTALQHRNENGRLENGMASYNELATITENPAFGALVEKIRAAIVIKAVAYLNEVSPTAAEVDWAKAALAAPAAQANDVMWYVLGANAGATMTQILNASDNAVQTNVNAAADAITAGGA